MDLQNIAFESCYIRSVEGNGHLTLENGFAKYCIWFSFYNVSGREQGLNGGERICRILHLSRVGMGS